MAATTLSRKSFYVYFDDRYDLLGGWSSRSARSATPSSSRSGARAATWRPARAWRSLRLAELYAEHGPLLRALAEASSQDDEGERLGAVP